MSSLNLGEMVSAVKTLFFRRQYKRCANYCVRYLNDHDDQLHPSYKIFLLYFAGISNDCYARGMYSRSPLIPSTLDEAEAFFTRAKALLCEARVVTPHSYLPHLRDDGGEDSDDSSSSRSVHRSRHSEDTTSRPSTAATSVSNASADTDILFYDWAEEFNARAKASCFNNSNHQELSETPVKEPLPAATFTSLLSDQPTPSDGMTSRPRPRLASFYLLRFPPSDPPTEPAPPVERPKAVQFEDDVPFPDEDECFHEPDHVEIYNSQLATFSDMLTSHIASIRRFRMQTHAANAAASVSITRGGTGKRKMTPEERMERIVRGRERGWTRPRFDPTRYQELCELAIAEL